MRQFQSRLSAEMQALLATVVGNTDREKLETLLAEYAKHHPPADDRFVISGWKVSKLVTPQTCYECDQPVVGECYEVLGREWFAHVGCIED